MKLPVAGILFDLDNTLADREQAFYELCKRLWEREPVIKTQASLPDAHRLFSMWDSDGTTFPKRKLFEATLSEWGELSRSPVELESWYNTEYPSCFVPDQRVLELVNQLDVTAIPWAIVTNGPPFQADVIESIGLARAQERTVISAVFGSSKPDPAIFREGLRRVGLTDSPQHCLFVGDNPTADIGGAKALGMQTAWVKRDREWPSTMPSPGIQVDHVAELARILKI